MKIVIAPDSFKETLTAVEVAKAIKEGFEEIYPNATYECCPIADGGEGSLEALFSASGGRKKTVKVMGPLGDTITAEYGILSDERTVIIEMAKASGLELVRDEERNPLVATTFGTGQLILDAIDNGYRDFIVCLGGSATNDGGIGMMKALGVEFLNDYGNEIPHGGEALLELDSISILNIDKRLSKCRFRIACDVKNPLVGSNGASFVYGPQKGATQKMVETLDKALKQYAEVLKRNLNISVANTPGSGAAGGMGAAFFAFTNSSFEQGVELVIDAISLDDKIRTADLVITGEGRLDSQSMNGKVPYGVAQLTSKYNKPLLAIAGALSDDIDELYQEGIDAAFSSMYKIVNFHQIKWTAAFDLTRISRNVAAAMKVGAQLK